MNSKILILVLLTQIVSILNSQVDSLEKHPKLKKYSAFLRRDSTNENYLLTGGVKYQITTYSESFSTNGYYVTGGLNLARFFSKKFVLGIAFDFSTVHNSFFRDVTSKKFIAAFNESFIKTYASQEDSAVAYEFKSRINGGTFGKGGYTTIGLMISPFPNKYGGLLLALKYGSSSHWVGPFYSNRFVNNGQEDHIYFSTKIYTAELTIKPFTFFRNSAENYWAGKYFAQRNLSVSFSYDKFVIDNVVVYNTKLSSMVAPDFLARYGTTHRFVLSLGFTLY